MSSLSCIDPGCAVGHNYLFQYYPRHSRKPLLRYCGLQHEVFVSDGKHIIRLGFIIKAKNCTDQESLNSTFGATTRANMDEIDHSTVPYNYLIFYIVEKDVNP
jgi:hypothetical protein